jgi:hypothetical protein
MLACGLAAPAPASAPASFPVPAGFRLVNYYPAHAGWSYMWQRWNARAIDSDFARIAALHANAVRVIVQTRTFGYPTPRAVYRARLARVIALAAKHGLRVELTLFDWWHDYPDLAGSEEWARDLLAPYAGDPRLAAIEIQNEPDPADAAATAWVAAMLPFLRTIDGGIPLTVSVAPTDPVGRLQLLKTQLGSALPDFWSVHFYDRPEVAYAVLAAVQQVAAPLPLFVGETGYWPGASFPRPRSRADLDDEQVRFLRTVAAACAALGLPPPAPWTLLDFSRRAIPSVVASPEYHFGLFRVDGSAKPAAAAVRDLFAGAPVSGFDGGFEEIEHGVAPTEPALWRRLGAAAFARDTTVAHSGGASASIAGVAGVATSGALYATATSTPWVYPGETTTLSVWARGRGATGTTTISIAYYGIDGHRLGRTDSPPLADGTTPWTQLVVQAAAPPAAAFFRIQLRSDGDVGRVWFDDVAVSSS